MMMRMMTTTKDDNDHDDADHDDEDEDEDKGDKKNAKTVFRHLHPKFLKVVSINCEYKRDKRMKK